ncbi:hypothetical protein BH24ACT12_BH24ACT12_14110 [soil metagenome]
MNLDMLGLQGTITVEEAASVLGVSRGVAYESARTYLRTGGKEGLPVIRMGRRLLVPTPALQRMLGCSALPGPARHQ